MPRIEIGVGAIVTAVVGLLGSSTELSVALLVFGGLLTLHGAYDFLIKPNLLLERTVGRWLERHYWKILETRKGKPFYFTMWVEDEAGRRVMISREHDQKRTLAFTAPIELDAATIRGVSTKLSATDQQKLYEELHILLASMDLAWHIRDFTNMSVQDGLLINEQLTEHTVFLEASRVAHGVAAARSLVRKAVL